MAQEVEAVINDVFGSTSANAIVHNSKYKEGAENDEAQYAMTYTEIIPYLTAAIKDLSAQVTELKTELLEARQLLGLVNDNQ